MLEFTVKQNNEVLDVELKGRLDATYAPQLMEEMTKYSGEAITKIVYHVAELEYIASAGLRVIIFSKQKIGQNAEVILEKPCETVVSVIDMTGLQNFVTIE